MEILTTLKIAISKVVVGALLTLSGWAGMPLSPQNVGADTMQYVGGTSYTLSGSGVSSSATSIALSSLTIPQNSYPLQDADFASTFYLTFEPGGQARQEFASCTTVGTNSGSAVTLSGCTRGLSPISPYTASSTLRFTHAGGTKIIFSNSPAFYDQFVAKGNDETITGIYSFSASPTVPTPTTATQSANKTYVDSVANAGAATSTESNGGLVELGTLAEQASSYDGGSNKPTLLQTKNSTSTCQVVGSYNIVASSTTGKLDKNCFDGGLNYTFSGTNLHTASTTFTATTTISASSVTNNALVLNGIKYAFPSSDGTSGFKLQTNGAGTLSWTANRASSYNLLQSVDLIASGEPTTAFATSTALGIPASTFTASSTVEISGSLQCQETGANAGSCIVYLRDSAGTQMGKCTLSATNSATAVGGISLFTISNNSTSAQSAICNGTYGTTGGTILSNFSDEITSSVDLSVAKTLYVVLEGNSAIAALEHFVLIVNP